MELLTCKEVVVGYGGRPIAGKLNFQINEGDYLCIVGENGAGKSTLLKALLNLLPLLDGEVSLSSRIHRRQIGYLPQHTSVPKDFPASVREVVRSGCAAGLGRKMFYGKEENEKAAKAMERLHISGLSKKCFRDLSGGQQQRVLLARALCSAQKMLFLDEPVSGLDPGVTSDMYRIVADENKRGMAVVMISHDMRALCDATHVLFVGQNCFFGTVEEFKKSSRGKYFLPDDSFFDGGEGRDESNH